MARPMKPLVRSGGYYPSNRLTPLVYPGGYTTANGGGEPEPPSIEKTITGNPIHITDALAKPVQALSVKLEPIQDLHGYDSPWPAGGGKNKSDIEERTLTTNSGQEDFLHIYCEGCTATKSDGSITVTNTGPWSKLRFKFDTSKLINGQTYTLSALFTNPNAQTLLAGYNDGSWHTSRSSTASSVRQSITFTYDSSWTSLILSCITNNTSQGTNKTVTVNEIQFELGSTATSYAPYSNICPISGHTDADVTRTGKNLLPIQTISKSGSTYYVGDVNTYFFFKAGTYTVSNVGTAAYMYWRKKGTTDNNVIHAANANSGTFTLTEDCEIRFWFYTNVADASFTDIQIELGSTASAYSPYVGTTYPIPLGQTVYGGTLDVTTGKLTVTMASADLGTLTYTYMSLSGGRNAFVAHIDGIVPHASNGVPIKAISSAYKAVSYNSTWTSGDMSYTRDATGSGDKQQVTFINNDYTDAPTFKTAMNGVQLCYELATPITIQLTPQQVELLLGENNLFSDGEMTLVYLADGNASDEEALNILLGGRYVNNHTEDEPTDREALDILLGGNTR